MEVEKMNANLLPPVFLHTFDPFIQSKEVDIYFRAKKLGLRMRPKLRLKYALNATTFLQNLTFCQTTPTYTSA